MQKKLIFALEKLINFLFIPRNLATVVHSNQQSTSVAVQKRCYGLDSGILDSALLCAILNV
jgi:hypothetical protein